MDAMVMFFWGIVGGITIAASFKASSEGLYFYKSATNTPLIVMVLLVLLGAAGLALFGGDLWWRNLLYELAVLWAVGVIDVFSPSSVFFVKRKTEVIENRIDSEPE